MEENDNFIVLPKISDQELLVKFYSLADVFVICSKRENFPTTCIEAQCCGTPVVGFDTGGTKETSLYGEENFVEYGNIEALAEKIRKMNETSHTDLAGNADVAFSKSRMFEQYLDEYDKEGIAKRVLLLDVNCKYSSTGKIVYDLYTNLKKEGREAAICYGRGEIIKEKNIFKFGLDFETYVHAMLARLTGINGCFSYFSTKRLIDYIEKFQPDVIHIHELHAYFVNIGMLLKYLRKKNIRIVWTFHCEYMYTGKCGHAYECTKFQKECNNCPAIHEYPKSLFFDRTKRMFQMKKKLLSDFDMTIVTPSQWLAERVKLSFLKNRNIKVIHNGIDTQLFRPIDASELRNELKISESQKVVLAVAPDIMSESKGGEWVLKLAEEMKSEAYVFVLVGKE